MLFGWGTVDQLLGTAHSWRRTALCRILHACASTLIRAHPWSDAAPDPCLQSAGKPAGRLSIAEAVGQEGPPGASAPGPLQGQGRRMPGLRSHSFTPAAKHHHPRCSSLHTSMMCLWPPMA